MKNEEVMSAIQAIKAAVSQLESAVNMEESNEGEAEDGEYEMSSDFENVAKKKMLMKKMME